MNRSRWLTIALCVTGSFMVAWGLNWFTVQLVGPSEPARLAYKPVENMPPQLYSPGEPGICVPAILPVTATPRPKPTPV